MGRLGGFRRPPLGGVPVTLGGHFNTFFHSGILFIQIPIRHRSPLTASPSYVPACQHFVHTRQALPAAFCVNNAQGLPLASCRGSRLPNRPLEAEGTGATASLQASGVWEPATPSSPAGVGDLGPKEGGNPGLDR